MTDHTPLSDQLEVVERLLVRAKAFGASTPGGAAFASKISVRGFASTPRSGERVMRGCRVKCVVGVPLNIAASSSPTVAASETQTGCLVSLKSWCPAASSP
jgi:hypothetical protein